MYKFKTYDLVKIGWSRSVVTTTGRELFEDTEFAYTNNSKRTNWSSGKLLCKLYHYICNIKILHFPLNTCVSQNRIYNICNELISSIYITHQLHEQVFESDSVGGLLS